MALQKSLVASHLLGKSAFFGKLADTKEALRAEMEMVFRLHMRDGGMVQVCRPAIAVGSEFNRLQRPRLQ